MICSCLLQLPFTCLLVLVATFPSLSLSFPCCCFGCPPFSSHNFLVECFSKGFFLQSMTKDEKKVVCTHWMHSDWSFEVVSSYVPFLLVFCFYWVDERCLCLLFLLPRHCLSTSFWLSFQAFYWILEFGLHPFSQLCQYQRGLWMRVEFQNPIIPLGWHEPFGDYTKRDFNYRAHFNSSFACSLHRARKKNVGSE